MTSLVSVDLYHIGDLCDDAVGRAGPAGRLAVGEGSVTEGAVTEAARTAVAAVAFPGVLRKRNQKNK